MLLSASVTLWLIYVIANAGFATEARSRRGSLFALQLLYHFAKSAMSVGLITLLIFAAYSRMDCNTFAHRVRLLADSRLIFNILNIEF